MHNKTQALWNKLAAWWDEACDDGDIFHRTLLFPTITAWVAAQPGMRILDIGCGNGALARLFAKSGANVVATDFSDVFIAKAQQRSKGLPIEYRVIDATESVQLKKLIDSNGFDCITCSMVINNMPTVTPLVRILPHLLKPAGKFIFSVPHPCFNSGLVDMQGLEDHMAEKQLLLPNRYIKPEAFEIFAKPGQPVKQINFHRSLSQLANELFSVGMIMTGFIEPVDTASELPSDSLWARLAEIPPVIIARWEIKKQ